jgi:hypothetical protein
MTKNAHGFQCLVPKYSEASWAQLEGHQIPPCCRIDGIRSFTALARGEGRAFERAVPQSVAGAVKGLRIGDASAQPSVAGYLVVDRLTLFAPVLQFCIKPARQANDALHSRQCQIHATQHVAQLPDVLGVIGRARPFRIQTRSVECWRQSPVSLIHPHPSSPVASFLAIRAGRKL